MSIKQHLTRLLLVPVCALGGAAQAAGESVSEHEVEIQDYIEIFQRDSFQVHHHAIGELEWTGISDERVYDPIAARVKQALEESGGRPSKLSSSRIDELSWYAKALGLSGNAKYRPLLEKLVQSDSNTLNYHAEKGVEFLEQFSEWNPIIAEGVEDAPPGKLGEWRARNMLQSDIPELIRVGAKRIYHEYPWEQDLLQTANGILLEHYENPGDGLMIDALAWICKALGRSGEDAYRQTLEKVVESSPSAKLRKYARKSL